MAAKGRPGAATYADLQALPPHVVGEILHGVLHANPRPALRHARAASALGVTLGGPFDLGSGGPGGWLILDEPELHLGSDVLVPDLAAWRRERMPELPDAPYATLPPDWACEVLSPSTESADRGDKLGIFAREGVRHVWFVNPITRTLEVMRLDGETYRVVAVHRDDAQVHAEPFDAIALELAALWAA